MKNPLYDTIGKSYITNRQADNRITDNIIDLLNLPGGSLIADIGAGTGNYSNTLADRGYHVIAIEPSPVMRDQSSLHPGVNWISGTAESVPLQDKSVDGVMIILALHHFQSIHETAAELHRICPRGPVAILTYDPRLGRGFWFNEYFPEIYKREFNLFPPHEEVTILLAGDTWKPEIRDFPLPHDLSDKNMHSGWNRPEIYLDEQMRSNTSGFARAPESEVEKGLSLLKEDLQSGTWDAKYGRLRDQKALHTGFVFIKLMSETGQDRL
jgi:ubiquinone/menaquinone biosynthesis C-methylase UbiE